MATRTSGSAGGPGKRSRRKAADRAPAPPNHVKVRDRGRVLSKALVIAYGVPRVRPARGLIGLGLGEIERCARSSQVPEVCELLEAAEEDLPGLHGLPRRALVEVAVHESA